MRFLLCLLLVCLTVTGCWGGSEGDGQTDSFARLPTVEPAKVEVPRDRDPRAVKEALRRVDPCALVDLARMHHRLFGASPQLRRIAPHRCVLYDSTTPDRSFEVVLGSKKGAGARYVGRRIDIDGAAAYAVQPGSSVNYNCQILVPVSFDLVVDFEFTNENPHRERGQDVCATAARLVSDTIPLLRQPDSTARALDSEAWSACDLLARAVSGQMPVGHVLRIGDGSDGLDECGLYRKGLDLPDHGVRLTYDAHVLPRATTTTVHGKTVHVSGDMPCHYRWRQWPDVRDTSSPGIVMIDAPNCQRASEMTRAVMTDLAGSPQPRPEVSPQRPLSYAFDEADAPVVGACIDLNPRERADCRPYTSVDVPEDPVELIRHAEADRNVNCSLAIDEVRKHFGRDMAAVTVSTTPSALAIDVPFERRPACVFVEPEHGIEVWVQATSEPMEATTAELGNGRIGGHRAVIEAGIYGRLASVALDGAGDPGQLMVGVVQQLSGAGWPRTMKRERKAFDSLAADLVREHL